MNSIAMYCLADSKFPGFVRDSLKIHVGRDWADRLSFTGERFIQFICHRLNRPAPTTTLSFGPVIEAGVLLLVLWLICLWMYRRKIFLRI
jgi:predicted acyltransferase